MIVLPNIDGHIWDLEYKVLDMVKEYQSTGMLVVDLNSEGPDATEIGLYKLLDTMCDRFDFVKSNITVVTRNVLEKHAEYNVIVKNPLYVREIQKFALTNDISPKRISKHFGIFIGRSNAPRLLMSSTVYNLYKDQSVQTFHYDPGSDFHKSQLGLENLLHIEGNRIATDLMNLINASPIRTEVPGYPILTPANMQIANLYQDFFVELVCETYSKGRTFYPTEKIWRPIVCLTPFILQGPIGYLKHLRAMGFKTFGDYWDESYDYDGWYGIRTIQENLKRISAMSDSELTEMYSDMKPILQYNRDMFMDLKDSAWSVFK